jgi:hypothetical protein
MTGADLKEPSTDFVSLVSTRWTLDYRELLLGSWPAQRSQAKLCAIETKKVGRYGPSPFIAFDIRLIAKWQMPGLVKN